VLRCHGMNEEELRLVYKTVVLAKILYASPAWWGFNSAADRQRIEAFCPSWCAALTLLYKRPCILWRSSLLTMTTSSGKCYTTSIMYWSNYFLTR